LFTAAWVVNLTSSSRREKQYTYDPASIMAAIGVFTVLVVLLAGEVFARSRAGIALTMVALLASIALGFSQRGAVTAAAPGRKILIGAVVVAIAFSLQFALYRVLERVSDPTEDSRPAAAVTTFEAASANMPLGSGIGTFVPVYATFEKPQDVAPYYMNRAHNDVLEASLESGVLGLALMGLFATWLVRRSLAVWRSAPAGGANRLDWSLVRAATLVAGLIAAHSFVDYPLRTSAMTAIMAFACALLIEPPVGVYSRKRQQLVVPRKIHTHDARNLEPVAAPALAVSRPQSPGPIPPTPGAMPPVPRPVPQTSASILSLSPDQRWGTDIEWPEEWSNRSEREGSAGKTVAPNSSKPPKG
jgi:hypothetical protein